MLILVLKNKELISENPLIRTFLQVAAVMHTNIKTSLISTNTSNPHPAGHLNVPEVEGFRFSCQNKSSVSRTDAVKSISAPSVARGAERNLGEFSYCQLQLSLNILSATVITQIVPVLVKRVHKPLNN